MDVATDQLITAEAAQSLTADVRRDHGLVGWIVIRDQPRPDAFTARLVTDTPTPYVLQAETLEHLRALLPPGLVRSDRQPWEPPDLQEIWFLE